MISKSKFIQIMTNIQRQGEIDHKVSEALELVSDTYVMFGTKNLMYDSLHSLLKEVMNDKDEFISWWLYEDVEKVITIQDNKGTKKINVDTLGKLYDYLIEYYPLEDSTKKKEK